MDLVFDRQNIDTAVNYLAPGDDREYTKMTNLFGVVVSALMERDLMSSVGARERINGISQAFRVLIRPRRTNGGENEIKLQYFAEHAVLLLQDDCGDLDCGV